METTLEKITPALATKYLEKNTNNRHIRQSHVDFLAEEIKKDRWLLNGATIVFDGDQLVDGQHRLWAVVTANKPISSLVTRGVDKDCYPTIDTGISRTGGDALSIAGLANANMLSASARWIMNYHAGKSLNRMKISNSSVVDFMDQNAGLIDSVSYIKSLKGTDIFSRSIAAALHYMMRKKDEALANELFSGLYKGFPSEAAETLVYLREKLISCATGHARPRPIIMAIYVIKAWNARRKGLRMRIFKYVEGEDFPRIR